MPCHPPTAKQLDYAESLVDYLKDNDHRSTARFKKELTACDCIAKASKLIDKLVKARKEMQDADYAARPRG